MYVIYSDGSPIYSPNLIQHGYSIISGKITKELNKAGSLEFSIPKSNPMYSKISKLKSTITVEDYGKEIWRGRVLEEQRDFYGNKKFFCEGELAYLNDTYANAVSYTDRDPKTILTNIMNRYASTASDYRMIKFGDIHGFDSSDTVTAEVPEPTDGLTWLTTVLLDTIGGYFIIERRNGTSYLEYYKNFDDRVSDQVIEFGKNLIDFEEYINAADVYTYIVPYGKKQDNGKRLTIESVNNGLNYLYSKPGEELFGKIYRAVIWENTENLEKLKDHGKKRLDKVIEAATNITINAVDLKDLGVDVSRIDIGWMYPIVSAPHDIFSNSLCSKVVLDLGDRANNEYTFGMEFDSLTKRQAASYKTTKQTYLVSNDYLSDSINMKNVLNEYKTSTEEEISILDKRITELERRITDGEY